MVTEQSHSGQHPAQPKLSLCNSYFNQHCKVPWHTGDWCVMAIMFCVHAVSWLLRVCVFLWLVLFYHLTCPFLVCLFIFSISIKSQNSLLKANKIYAFGKYYAAVTFEWKGNITCPKMVLLILGTYWNYGVKWSCFGVDFIPVTMTPRPIKTWSSG